jgi:hypothetical protein
MGLFQDRKRKVGVVDIVVTDRNLHRPFLFDRAVYGPTAKALGSWRTDMHSSAATGTCSKARSNGICQGSIWSKHSRECTPTQIITVLRCTLDAMDAERRAHRTEEEFSKRAKKL